MFKLSTVGWIVFFVLVGVLVFGLVGAPEAAEQAVKSTEGQSLLQALMGSIEQVNAAAEATPAP